MHIETKYHGAISVPEADHKRFPNGLPGFETEKMFVLLPFADNTPYYILQSVKTPELAFVLVNPFLFFETYQFTLDDHTKQAMDVKAREELAVYTVVTLKEPFEETTVNLKAPIVINQRTGKARQMILEDQVYTTRQLLVERNEEASECSS
ncbi:flagellar assembly protein FliW [Aureibacillus halotolerans]|uniref:Flagellar assembly factor FliW n=1 Tax=Aureibacillus halotolerans TaxID=1508390 RepID=A0A4R6TW44_9BACI|nr:flagellar assembly protein FliW [Aureibacillus halotolerans]TDQ36932.1 flagellar assembly factor FliW [Aureibacillus halotolerans]